MQNEILMSIQHRMEVLVAKYEDLEMCYTDRLTPCYHYLRLELDDTWWQAL